MTAAEPSHAEPFAPEQVAEPARVLLHTTVDVRSVSLAVLATLASLFAMRWASDVVIPVMAGLLFS